MTRLAPQEVVSAGLWPTAYPNPKRIRNPFYITSVGYSSLESLSATTRLRSRSFPHLPESISSCLRRYDGPGVLSSLLHLKSVQIQRQGGDRNTFIFIHASSEKRQQDQQIGSQLCAASATAGHAPKEDEGLLPVRHVASELYTRL